MVSSTSIQLKEVTSLTIKSQIIEQLKNEFEENISIIDIEPNLEFILIKFQAEKFSQREVDLMNARNIAEQYGWVGYSIDKENLKMSCFPPPLIYSFQ